MPSVPVDRANLPPEIVGSRHRALGTSGWDHDASLKKIDSQMGCLVQPSAARRRNGFNRWCCLPSELLCLVCVFAQELCGWPAVRPRRDTIVDNEFDEMGHEGLSYNPGWITMIHVCATWREVFLASPLLWTQPKDCFAIPGSLWNLITQRSGQLPLHLEIHGETTLSDIGVDLRLAQCFSASTYDRVEQVHTFEIPLKVYEKAAALLRKALPGLDKLILDLQDPSHVPALPKELCLSPNVTELALYGCRPWRWDSPILSPLLTSLTIHLRDGWISPDLLPSTTQLVNLLSSMKSLRYLILGDVFSCAPPSSDCPPCNLPPTLRSLHLTASDGVQAVACAMFIPHLNYSHDTRLDIHMFVDTSRTHIEHDAITVTGAPSFKSLASSALRHLYRQSAPTHLTFDDEVLLSHNSMQDDGPTLMSSCSNIPGVTSQVRFYIGVFGVYRSIDFASIPAFSLRAISLVCPRAYALLDQEAWWSWLSDATNVRCLGVSVGYCTKLSRLARSPAVVDSSRHLWLPRLKTVHIYADDGARDRGEQHARDACLPFLLNLARGRHHSGSPFSDVVVDECLRGLSVWDTIRKEENITLSFCAFSPDM
ncbi:hypothetical protein PENSPDRAFT_694346 [Peniophora sp. CONT]|nr:hypothetical protein PENSPDRAFT_694346 [Peniophora sp. CONT]